jgi:hypothetical protein
MNTKRILFLVVLFVSLFYGCGKDCSDDTNPECPNYNPCKNIQKTSASFKVYDYVGFIQLPPTWEWYDTDTVRFGCIIEADFYSVAGGISYEWLIDGTRYSGRRIEFKDGLPKGKNLNIQLIVRNQNVKKSCYPDDDGVDTFRRSIYVLAQGQESRALWGIYRGAFEDKPLDSIDFVVHFDSLKVNFPTIRCKNEFNYEFLNNNTTWLYITSIYINPPNESNSCNYNNSSIFTINKFNNFTLKFFDEKDYIKVNRIMKGRKIKQL